MTLYRVAVDSALVLKLSPALPGCYSGFVLDGQDNKQFQTIRFKKELQGTLGLYLGTTMARRTINFNEAAEQQEFTMIKLLVQAEILYIYKDHLKLMTEEDDLV